jgi:SPP1 family predicted phage head-tail adaptor
MRAGKLRHKVTLQSPAGSRDAVGQRTTVWTTVDTVRGAIIPLKSDSRFLAAQAHASTTHRIRIRYQPEIAGIDGSWRVLFGSRVFTIDGVINVDERSRELELLSTEQLGIPLSILDETGEELLDETSAAILEH